MISVLVVDDFRLLRDVTCRFLEKRGDIIVDTSDSTQDALRKLEYIAFDAIVTDYNLRDGSGIDLLRVLRERDVMIPVVYFTLDDNPGLRSAAEEFENVVFVPKLGGAGSTFSMMEQELREIVGPRPAISVVSA